MKTLHASTLAAIAALSSACSMLPVADQWDDAPKHKPLPAALIEVDDSGIARYCGGLPGYYIHGCARRDYESRVCFIFTRARPAQWLVEHERKHCDGWDHGAVASSAFNDPVQTAAEPVGHSHGPAR